MRSVSAVVLAAVVLGFSPAATAVAITGPVQAVAAPAPAILATYPLPTRANWSLLALPGQLWVGTFGARAAIDVRSPADGSLIGTIPLAVGRRQIVEYMVFDGHRVWALVADISSGDTISGQKVQFVAIDPATRHVTATVKLPKVYPLSLSYSAGRVIAAAQCGWFAINPSTAKVVAVGKEGNCPGLDEMTAGGGFIWVADTDPRGTQVWNASTLKYSRSLGISVSVFTLAGPKMWAVGAMYASAADRHPATLFAFDSHRPAAAPRTRIFLDSEYHLSGGVTSIRTPEFMAYDGTALWLMSKLDRFLSQHDPVTGHLVRRIALETPAVFAAATDLPKGLSFDGRDMWVLTSGRLIRIGLPQPH